MIRRTQNIYRDDNSENVPPIIKREMKNIIKHLKNDKIPGPDGIANETLKNTLTEVLTPATAKLFIEIVET